MFEILNASASKFVFSLYVTLSYQKLLASVYIVTQFNPSQFWPFWKYIGANHFW